MTPLARACGACCDAPMTLERLKTDFPFALIVGLGVVAISGITPLAAMRFARGELLYGWIDVAIMVGVGLLVAYVWRGGSTRIASRVATIVISAGAAAIAFLDMRDGMMWIYAVIVANFLLSTPRWGLAVSLTLVVMVALKPGAFDGNFSMLSYLITGAMVSAFTFVFAHRSQSQHRSLRRLAEQDPLTGLGNRRALERAMRLRMERATRGQPCSLVLLDLDHFKRINDNHGHERGDLVLCDLARIVRRETREDDELFRLGGEEFVLLQPGVDGDILPLRVRQLQDSLRRELRCEDDPATVSIGAAVWRAGDDAATWLSRADRAMYQAKREGRDRAVVDGQVQTAG